MPAEDHHRSAGAARRERAVHGQVGHVQQPEGDIDAQRHQPPDQALRDAAGHVLEQPEQAQRRKIGLDTHVIAPWKTL